MVRPEGSPETKAIFESWLNLFPQVKQIVEWGSYHTDIATAFAEHYARVIDTKDND